MQVRKLRKYVPLTREQFRARFYERFCDPAFDDVKACLLYTSPSPRDS